MSPRPEDQWPTASVATLRRMWAAGDSAGVIAPAVNRSRPAVIGKLHRLGLGGDPNHPRGGIPKGQRVKYCRAGAAPIYKLPLARATTKGDLRAMYVQAFINTAALAA